MAEITRLPTVKRDEVGKKEEPAFLLKSEPLHAPSEKLPVRVDPHDSLAATSICPDPSRIGDALMEQARRAGTEPASVTKLPTHRNRKLISSTSAFTK